MKESKLTQERLKQLLRYDKLTGIFVWKIQRKGCSNGSIAGTLTKKGYVQIMIDRKTYLAHRLAWLYEKGYLPENGLDHKDQEKNHNWILNLRELSPQCNIRNTSNPKNNTSGVKGVYWNNRDKKWRACIEIFGRNKSTKSFSDFSEAVCHRLAMEQCLDWENCDSSSPAYQYVKKMLSKPN